MNARRHLWLAVLAALGSWMILANPVAGQSLPDASAPAVTEEVPATATRADELERQASVGAELESARAALAALAADGREVPAALRETVDQLTKLDLLYAQVLAALDHATELSVARERVSSDLAVLRSSGPPESRPFEFSLVESLRDQLETELSRKQSRADSVDEAQSSLAEMIKLQDAKERDRRKAKEALENSSDPAKKADLAAAFQQAHLASRVAEVEVRLRRIELQNQKLENDLRTLQVTLLQEKIDLVVGDVQFNQAELDAYLAELDLAELRLTQLLEQAQADFTIRDAEWAQARRRLEVSPTRAPELVEEYAARELARRMRQREVALLGEQIQAVVDSRKAWNRRFQIANQQLDDATIEAWQAETRQVAEQMDRDLRINLARLAELRREAGTLDARITSAADGQPDVARWIERQKYHRDAMNRVYQATVEQLESAQRLHQKLLSEISVEVDRVTWLERLAKLRDAAVEIWNYEITSVKDSPITVKKLVIGLGLLVLGWFVSRRVADWFGRRFLPRFGLNEGAIAAIQSILFYLLLLSVAMISLRIINVPLTAFTILGGALAIGLGFGSQNIVNNFISGLILLTERPIRVGDLVQIDDLVGVISHIGPRSTRVRSPENVDIIVPNSSFLEKNVKNWTLTDDRFRAAVSVGVVYGSPVREVCRLIRKALDEHGKVLSKPEPIVLFEEFGDNALVFEAHFWVPMRRMMDCRIIQSDIRSRLDALFREAGIVVAFPQRDVHLDVTAPLQVELLNPARPGNPGETGSGPAAASEPARPESPRD